MNQTIGVISDTHGLLRPEAVSALQGSDLIIHAGDIGRLEVIEQLAVIAPVKAIRGNIDQAAWANEFPETEVVEANDTLIYVLHNLKVLDLDPKAAGFRVVVSGHSHQPKIAEKDGTLYLNPGSAGPRRFKLPIAVGRLTIAGERIQSEILPLDIPR
ncbi:MAG: metallophosphoesterase family protein [Leptolyngbya sp. SIOISBB]|nr:metallophosphoesterase family protein [Leptolyngbya sp. SIOISBB]